MSQIVMKGLDHVALVVRNLDRSKEWYSAHLGLKALDHAELRDGEIAIAYLGGPGLMLELFQRDDGLSPNDGKDPFEALANRGIPHFAVAVDDADESARILAEAGVDIILEPRDSPGIPTRIFFARDPDGNQIEFVERLSSGAPMPR